MLHLVHVIAGMACVVSFWMWYLYFAECLRNHCSMWSALVATRILMLLDKCESILQVYGSNKCFICYLLKIMLMLTACGQTNPCMLHNFYRSRCLKFFLTKYAYYWCLKLFLFIWNKHFSLNILHSLNWFKKPNILSSNKLAQLSCSFRLFFLRCLWASIHSWAHVWLNDFGPNFLYMTVSEFLFFGI